MKIRLFAAAALAAAWSIAAAEEAYEFRRRLECVHEKNRRVASERPAADEMEIKDGFKISIAHGADGLVYRAARDFEDYLAVSMGVMACVTRSADPDVTVDRSLPPRRYVVDVSDGRVRIAAADERAAARAFYHLEDVMNLRSAPFLKKGRFERTPRFDVRMTHSGYGNDIFPDDHLAQMAHFGMTAILVFLDDIDKTKAQDYQDLKALIRRAAKYGLDTYLYSYIKAFAHPADKGGREIIERAYGNIAGYYPEAKGVILVGESCQFPSKDPRVQPVLYQDKNPADKRPAAGWFPCSDYPQWLEAVKSAIHAKAPRQELVFWTYNWGWAPYDDRMKLIDSLPKDVTLMATFEMFERRTLRNGIDTPTADYSISFVGPGRYFVSEAERAKRNGLRLYSQANSGGLCWDFGCVPFMPLPQRWNERWAALSAAHVKWGLSGLMENHHYGWWPSFIAELENEALTDGGMPFETHLAKIAARDYGASNAESAVNVWRTWSRNHADFAPTDMNQYGTFRIGPAYPFTFGAPVVKREEFPGLRYASNWPAGICRMDYLKEGYVPQLTPERMDNEYLLKEVELLAPMAEDYAAGARIFRRISAAETGRRRAKALEMADYGDYFAAAVRTAVNVKRGAVAFRKGDRAALLAAAKAEYANASAAVALVERNSRLGWEPSMEYCGGPVQIRWKLSLMEKIYGKENLK
ncbi:MAG: hypothetical protein J6T01_06140 [Kiritimatiellae bacterium]|nr:hypothetical protein [Kiritimatiellia bacterium]